MTAAVKKICALGSTSIRSVLVAADRLVDAFGGSNAGLLLSILQLKNGFFAFEKALHVFSDLGAAGDHGLIEWNADNLWRKEYDGMADGCLFFAEDILGTQFCIHGHKIFTFEPETGRLEYMATTVEEWAETVLTDCGLWTGYRLAREWQKLHGALSIGSRLVPKVPFVLGGEYVVDNLYAAESVKSMRFRASLAVQVRDLPDGSSVRIRLID